jgi:NADPH:quinone reductase-like Zn-dependent oxidoreductase
LAKDGVCVSLGISAADESTFDVRKFFTTGRTTLYGFILFDELHTEPAAVGLARLAGLIATGKLTPRISVEAPWTQIADVAGQLLDRSFPGKAVLHVGNH